MSFVELIWVDLCVRFDADSASVLVVVDKFKGELIELGCESIGLDDFDAVWFFHIEADELGMGIDFEKDFVSESYAGYLL